MLNDNARVQRTKILNKKDRLILIFIFKLLQLTIIINMTKFYKLIGNKSW